MTTDNSTTGSDAPTKPIFELTDSELEQEFLKSLKNLTPIGKEIAKALMLEMGARDHNHLSSDAPRSLLNQMLVKQLEAMSPEELKATKDVIWERFGSKLALPEYEEVGDE